MSPLIMLLEEVWYKLPAVTYTTVAVIAGLVASRLRETLGASLPETIDDIEKRKGNEKAESGVAMETTRYLFCCLNNSDRRRLMLHDESSVRSTIQ